MVDFNNLNTPSSRGKLFEWAIVHQIGLKKSLTYFLIFLSVVFWGYGIYGILDWFLITGPSERAAIARLHIDLVNYDARKPVRPLEVRGVTLLPGTRADAFATIKNPNSNWHGAFEYRFKISGEKTEFKNGFILPGEEKLILDLGIAVTGKPTRAELEIQKMKWSRVIPREISDYGTYRDARLAFDITGISYTPTLQVAGATVSRASFSVRNSSAFSYFEVPFQVILYRGGVIAGVNTATIANLASGEERQVDVTWFNTIAGITKVEVKPDLNIFDSSLYSR